MHARETALIIAVILPYFIIAISDVYNASFIKNVALCTTSNYHCNFVVYLLLSSLLCGGLYRNNFSQRLVCSKFIPTTARRVRLFKMSRQTGLWWPTREPLFFSSCMQCCVKQAPSEPSLQEPSRLLTVLQHQT